MKTKDWEWKATRKNKGKINRETQAIQKQNKDIGKQKEKNGNRAGE